MLDPATEQSKKVGTNFPQQRKCSKWSTLPVQDIARRKLFRWEPKYIESLAVRSWKIAPGETSITQPAHFLPNQLERVTGWAFSTGHPQREMEGGIEVAHSPTVGFLLKNAWLIDGVLYKDDACSYLHPRTSRWLPHLHVENEIDRAAVFCSAGGNKYFGMWLMDDCLTYPMACSDGVPVTTAQPASPHTLSYEDWLDMKPVRLKNAFFRELVVFEDVGQNKHKHTRARSMSEKLLSHVKVQPHPGVFIVRGSSGEQRIMHNEMELAESLRDKRGFRILDPMKSDVPTIMATCAGAQTVIGSESSGLMHGILVLPPGGAVLTLQPPNRFVPLYKHLTDRDQQNYGFVVGIADKNGFRIDADEVERTLDLFSAPPDILR